VKVSTKSRYGTRAVVCIARQNSDTPLNRSQISTKEDIPGSYLENILSGLKNAGILKAIRGANGGFILAKKPKDISVYDIVTYFQGSLSPVSCLDDLTICNKISTCSTRYAWDKLKKAQEESLKEITIQHLIDLPVQSGSQDFHI
jgi:Rrf2 family protein